MTMDVSRLAIEVTTGGTITQASRELGGLSTSAANADKRITKLTASIDKLVGSMTNLAKIQGTATSQAQAHLQLMQQNTTQLTSMGKSASAVAGQLQSLQKQANHTGNAFGHMHHKNNIVNNTLKSMVVALLTYKAINFGKSIIEDADAWAMMQSKLQIATGSMNNARVAQQDLFDLSQKYRMPLEETGKLYVRLSAAMKNMGKSHQDTIGMVEGVSLALQLGGATTAEAASTMLQFSQAANAGRLNGAEFNSVSENGTLILKALEEHLGKNRAELKKMGSEGKLTFDLIDAALRKMLPKWQEDFTKLPITVGGAMQRIKNAWMKAMGELNEDTGMNKGIVRFLHVIEQIIPQIRDGMASALSGVFNWIDNNQVALGQMWEQVKGITSDIWNLVTSIGGVLGMASEATGEFSMMAAAIFSVRLLIAGVQDGLVVIGALLLKVGAAIYKVVSVPFNIVLYTVEKIIDKFGRLIGVMGAGADAVGLTTLGEKLKSASDAIKGFASGVASVRDDMNGIGDYLDHAGDTALQHIASSDGAVQKLLNSEQSLTQTAAKRGTMEETLGKTRTKQGEEDEKAAKALAKALKAVNKEHDKAIQAYREQAESLKALQQYGLAGDKRTTAQKEQIRLEQLLSEATSDSVRGYLLAALATNKVTQEMEAQEKVIKTNLERQAEKEKATEKAIESAEEEAQKNEDLAATFGMTKGALEELELARVSEQLTRARSLADNDWEIDQLTKLENALRRNAAARKTLGEKEKAKKATEDYEKEWEKTVDKIDDVFRDGFADMLNNGKSAWKSFTKSLATTFKTVVAESIYKSFAKPLVLQLIASGAGMFGMTGLANAANNSLQAMGMVNGVSGMSSIGSTIGQGVSTFGNAIGSNSIYSFGQGLQGYGAGGAGSGISPAAASAGNMTSMASAYLASMAIGKMVSSAISDGYKINHGNALNNIGSLGGVIGSTITGLINRTFGMRPRENGAGGFQGNFSDAGFTNGQTFQRWSQRGGWLRSDREGTDYGAMDASFVEELTDAYTALRDANEVYAESLGLTTDAVHNYAKEFILALTGDQAQDAEILAKEFSKINDELAQTLLPNFADFAKKGETAGTVLQRLSVEYQAVDAVLKAIGQTFGAVGIASSDARSRLIELSGGIDAMASKSAYFAQNFLTEAEQLAPVQAAVTAEMARLGLATVTTHDQFKNTVLNLVSSGALVTEAGAQLYADLMNVAGAFDVVADAAAVSATRSNDIERQRIELGIRLMTAQGNAAGALADQRILEIAAMDQSLHLLQRQVWAAEDAAVVAAKREDLELRILELEGNTAEIRRRELAVLDDTLDPLQLRIWQLEDEAKATERANDTIAAAKDVLSDAYQRESSALEQTINKFKGFSKSLRDFKNSLLTGSLSTLSPEARYLELKRQFEQTSLRAMGGDAEAIGELQGISQQFLEASRDYFASSENYVRDFAAVSNALESSATTSDSLLSTAQAQLSYLQLSVQGILDVRNAVISVQQALQAYLAAGGTRVTTPGNTSSGTPSPAMNAVSNMFNDILGREGRAEGLSFWSNALVTNQGYASGETSIIRDFIEGAVNAGGTDAERAIAYARANGIPGFALGGFHSGGIRMVGEDGPEIEATGPARYFSASQTASMINGGGNDELLKEVLVELRAANQQRGTAAEVQIGKLEKLADKLDSNKRAIAANAAV